MSVIYRELLIFDKKMKQARKIEFHSGINIITSKLNSVGKTSLSLMLMYAFGAKVEFSEKWSLENIFTKLTLQKDDKDIVIIRYRDTYSIITDGEKFDYPVQKKGYSEKLYELLGLTIKIKDKNADTYSTAVPSLYLLPYYISQTKANEDRSVFKDLNMYQKNDLHDALYYHVGALDNEYSSAIQKLSKAKKDLENLLKNKEKQLAEIEYLETKLNQNKNIKTMESDKDLASDMALYEKFATKKKEYYELTKEAADIKRKIKLLNRSLIDNISYTNRLLDEEEIRCPVCNSDISDFISAALSIGTAEADINVEIADLKSQLLDIDRKIALMKPTIDDLQEMLATVERQREDVKVTRAIIVWNEELRRAKEDYADTQRKIEEYEDNIKELNKKLKNYSDKKKTADTNYRIAFEKLLKDTNIDTRGVDIQSLGLYDTINLSGSEIPRVAISRFFAMLESKAEESIVMPIIFDFPNLDMNKDNLSRCFKLMCEKINDTDAFPQSFVFSIDCEERIRQSGAKLENTYVIDMEKLPMDDKKHPRLLCESDFTLHLQEINQIIS